MAKTLYLYEASFDNEVLNVHNKLEYLSGSDNDFEGAEQAKKNKIKLLCGIFWSHNLSENIEKYGDYETYVKAAEEAAVFGEVTCRVAPSVSFLKEAPL